ncbi:60Kd inner membrane protein-domain-containing protein [Pholiota molesta]|nr:60Kd inner membrane protein-domain-containing protein [Pholiota molesta]
MAFVGLGVRKGALLSSSLLLRRSNANTRLFSSLLQQNSRANRVGAPFAFRSLSTSTPPSSSDIPEGPTPEVGLDATSLINDTVDTLASNVPPPLQYGDFAAMGLGGWSPSGLVEWSMELINVATGMPWFWTIVAGTAFWRALCVPFAVFALRASARMQPHQAAIEKHRLDVMEAYKSKNQLQLLRAQAASTAFNKKHGINPFAGLAGLVQLPITLGTFFAVREMGLLPLEQLKQSGFALIPDLTVPDPTYMLPALLCALVNLQISVAAKDMTLDARPGMGHLMNFLRIFSVMGFYVMTDFSGALVVSLLTTSTFTFLQTVVLQRPSVRRALDIPIVPRNKQGKLPSPFETLAYARKGVSDFIEAGKLQQQQQQKRR